MSSGAGAVLLAEPIENERQELLRYPDPCIAHYDVEKSAAEFKTDCNATARRCKLDRVAHEIPNHLLKPVRIARDSPSRLIELCLEFQPFFLGRRPNALDRCLENGHNFCRAKLECKLSADQARRVEKVFDQLGLRKSVPVDDLKSRSDVLITVIFKQHNLRPAEDRV